jgi:glutamine synthetase
MSMNPLQQPIPTFGAISLPVLAGQVNAGLIDTVLVCFPDMQGRLVGKRLHAPFFIEQGHKGIAACHYLLDLDVAMAAIPSNNPDGSDNGWGDFGLKPDFTTLRVLSWMPRTALVICDLVHLSGLEQGLPVRHSPREMLKSQLLRLQSRGLRAFCATELEFYVFAGDYAHWHAGNHRDLRTHSHLNGDYQIFQTQKDEPLMQQVRTQLARSGVEIEGSMGECSPGQQELNLRYTDALTLADAHVLSKMALKDMAQSMNQSVSFLAKWHPELAGSSAHIHLSLWDESGVTPQFLDSKATHGMSSLMRHFVAGLVAHGAETTMMFCPYVNSYKRFMTGSFAPTAMVWSVDNRSAALRVCSPQSQAIRIEQRIGGADLNPYVAIATMLCAGLSGLAQGLDLPLPVQGSAYREDLPQIPKKLSEAISVAEKSELLREAFGVDVLDHCLRAARWELSEFERAITDWEIQRGFERC